MADIFPGARSSRPGVGLRRADACRCCARSATAGTLHSFERREDFADIARGNVRAFFGGQHPAWTVTVGDLVESLPDRGRARHASTGSSSTCWRPGSASTSSRDALAPGGVLICYVATATQLSRVAEAARDHGGFTEPQAWESLVRGWHLEGLAVRPQHRMHGHTGFLITTRRLAPGRRPRRCASAVRPRARTTTPRPTDSACGPQRRVDARGRGRAVRVGQEDPPRPPFCDATPRCRTPHVGLGSTSARRAAVTAPARRFRPCPTNSPQTTTDPQAPSPTTRRAEVDRQRELLSEEVAALRRRLARLAARAARDAGDRGPPAAVVSWPRVRPERAPGAHAEGGPRADRHPQVRGRPAGPAAVRLRPHHRVLRRRRRSTSSPAAARCGSRSARRSTRPTWRPAARCMLNEALNVVAARGYERVGEVVIVKELLGDDRVLVVAHADEERVCRIADVASRASRMRVGDALMLDPRSSFVYERIPKAEVEELVLEEVPDIAYEDIGGLGGPDRADPRRRRAALPAPRPVQRAPAQAAEGRPALRPARLRQDAHRQGGRRVAGHEGRRARTGKPIGKSYFLNIKGPELLNKYVGETERHIRLIFQRAREKASDGTPGRRLLRRDGLAVPHPRVRASPPTSRRRSCRSCCPRSTASSGSRTSSSSARPTART